jgi:hypothetical protein
MDFDPLVPPQSVSPPPADAAEASPSLPSPASEQSVSTGDQPAAPAAIEAKESGVSKEDWDISGGDTVDAAVYPPAAASPARDLTPTRMLVDEKPDDHEPRLVVATSKYLEGEAQVAFLPSPVTGWGDGRDGQRTIVGGIKALQVGPILELHRRSIVVNLCITCGVTDSLVGLSVEQARQDTRTRHKKCWPWPTDIRVEVAPWPVAMLAPGEPLPPPPSRTRSSPPPGAPPPPQQFGPLLEVRRRRAYHFLCVVCGASGYVVGHDLGTCRRLSKAAHEGCWRGAWATLPVLLPPAPTAQRPEYAGGGTGQHAAAAEKAC